MFDPEKVEIAKDLQRAWPRWIIFWSPALREFTAIPLFDTGQLVVINAPATRPLLQEMGEIEMQASVGTSVSKHADAGERRKTDTRSMESQKDRAVRPSHGRHAADGGKTRGQARHNAGRSSLCPQECQAPA